MKPCIALTTILFVLGACAESKDTNEKPASLIVDEQAMNETESPTPKSAWNDQKYVSGRVATKEDMKAGSAVFFSPEGTTAYDMPLPTLAYHTDSDTGQKTKVMIVQAETGPDGVIIGAVYENGDHLLALLNEFELINE